MAFEYFREKKVDVAVLEVGMGGRLDATNIVIPLVSIITSVGFDHTQYLGTAIEDIAFEKAGIIKHGVRVVSAVSNGSASSVIKGFQGIRVRRCAFSDVIFRQGRRGAVLITKGIS